ncbi:glycosyltransferase family 2 protein [Nocardioides plantarum]|uniref:Glycosyltransferase family 2 protein n=1 Tax=Nocardioides plantarum TaxID=29299 RepID=A0ABV5K930_9ACTN|nr:glycosyltransferase family 2 protein [Nocardioides plantarum]
MANRLSLCICTMNRPDELAVALDSVRRGTVQPHELLVSDDGDGSAEAVARRFGATYQVGPRRGLGPNRNSVLDLATGDLVAFVDDDVIVSNEFVRESVSSSTKPNTVMTGWELNFASTSPRKVTPHNADFLGFQRVDPSGEFKSIVINATVFPASLFDHVRFDDRIRYGYEEIDISRQALKAGYRIEYNDLLWNEHHPASSNRDDYAQVLASSRLYLTYRAYRTYEGRPAKAAAFATVASAHHLAHSVKSKQGLRRGLSALTQARAYWDQSKRSA